MGHAVNTEHVWHKAGVFFAQKVDSLSRGDIQVRIYPVEQLGRELETIRMIKAGVADMVISGESMQNWTDLASLCGTPYLIRDLDHLNSVVEGPIGKEIAEGIREESGLRPIGYFARGPRYLTSNRPITHPDQLNGIILRVPPVPISVATWQALGAKPTPMAFSEVFTALQSGTVEAQENPFGFIHSAGFHEVQRYINLTGHVIGWVYLVMGEGQFQALSQQDRALILQAGEMMNDYHWGLLERQQEELREILQKNGMEFIEVDKVAFETVAGQAVAKAVPEGIRPVYDRIKALGR